MMKTYLIASLISLVLSVLFCRILLPLLKRWKAGQNILVYVEEHKGKSGTPTMGGIAFVFAILFSCALFTKFHRTLLVSLSIGVGYMVIGVLDDLLKKWRRDNLGLKAWQKMLFQTSVAVFASVYCMRANLTTVHIPFLNKDVQIGGWIIPLTIFVFLATVNAVNLTDGLDGLAGGTSVAFFLFLGIIIAFQKERALATLCFCIVGSLLGYLLFNVSPALMFMGDTGSLALGGFAASLSVFSGNALYLPVLGFCFVLSVISVILQVIYYKVTHGKRIFLMSPLHHHFQKKGYSEPRIAYAYFLSSAVIGALCVATII